MIIEDNPIVGVGQGNFQHEYAELLPPDTPEYRLYTHAHNDLLNVGVSTGLPGMLIYLGLWVVVLAYFWSAWRQLRSADDDRSAYVLAALTGSICFFGTSLTEATFVDEEVRALLMFLWGVGLFPWYKEQKEKVKPPGSHGKP